MVTLLWIELVHNRVELTYVSLWCVFGMIHINERWADGKSSDMKCPECPVTIGFSDVETLLTYDPAPHWRALFEKYQGFLLEAHLRTDPNVRWCPKPGCGNAMIGNRENPMMVSCLPHLLA